MRNRATLPSPSEPAVLRDGDKIPPDLLNSVLPRLLCVVCRVPKGGKCTVPREEGQPRRIWGIFSPHGACLRKARRLDLTRTALVCPARVSEADLEAVVRPTGLPCVVYPNSILGLAYEQERAAVSPRPRR